MPGAFSQEALEQRFSQINERLAAIEAQLTRLSGEADIPYEAPTSDVPPEVVELAQAGKTMEAMKLYRELTGAGAQQATTVIQGL